MEWAVAVASASRKPLRARDVGGKLQDALVVDLAQLRHAIVSGLIRSVAACGFPCPGPAWHTISRQHTAAPPIPNGALFPEDISRLRRDCNAQAIQDCRLESSHDPRVEPSTSHERHCVQEGRHPPETRRRTRKRPSRAEAEEAVRTLIAWAGDDPAREGLKDTPRRVTDAFEEYFSGYRARSRRGAVRDLRGGRRLRRPRHAARHPRGEPLRAPHGAVPGRGPRRLSARMAASSASPRSPAWSRSSPSACRRRRP